MPSFRDYFDHNEMQARLAALRARQFELNDYPRPEPSDAQIERERWQYEANRWAEQHPLYAAARASAVHRPILPLEPGGTKSLVPVADATMDERRILELWREFPTANVGTVVGRPYLIALHLKDLRAQVELRALQKTQHIETDHDAKSETSGTDLHEYQPWDFAKLYFVGQGQPFRAVSGWGTDASAKLRAIEQASKTPEELYLCWSYPPVQSGLDAFDYPGRRISSRVELLSPGTVVPWVGSRFEGGIVLQGPSGPLPEMPSWLGRKLGKPRSRKAMEAARQA